MAAGGLTICWQPQDGGESARGDGNPGSRLLPSVAGPGYIGIAGRFQGGVRLRAARGVSIRRRPHEPQGSTQYLVLSSAVQRTRREAAAMSPAATIRPARIQSRLAVPTTETMNSPSISTPITTRGKPIETPTPTCLTGPKPEVPFLRFCLRGVSPWFPRSRPRRPRYAVSLWCKGIARKGPTDGHPGGTGDGTPMAAEPGRSLPEAVGK